MENKSEIINSFYMLRQTSGYVVKNRWLWAYLIIPWILNFFLLFVFWFFVFNALQATILGLGFFEGSIGFLSGIINLFLFIVTGFIGILIFYLLASMIASPFNGLMVESMLKRSGYIKKNEIGFFKSIITELFRALKFEGIKIALILLFILASLLLGLLPIIGVLVGATLTYFGSTYLAIVEYYDPVLSSSGVEVRERFRYVKSNLKGNFALFMISGLMIYIPIVNILYIPFAVITATLTYIKSNPKR